MFCDLVGSTALSARLDPEGVASYDFALEWALPRNTSIGDARATWASRSGPRRGST